MLIARAGVWLRLSRRFGLRRLRAGYEHKSQRPLAFPSSRASSIAQLQGLRDFPQALGRVSKGCVPGPQHCVAHQLEPVIPRPWSLSISSGSIVVSLIQWSNRRSVVPISSRSTSIFRVSSTSSFTSFESEDIQPSPTRAARRNAGGLCPPNSSGTWNASMRPAPGRTEIRPVVFAGAGLHRGTENIHRLIHDSPAILEVAAKRFDFLPVPPCTDPELKTPFRKLRHRRHEPRRDQGVPERRQVNPGYDRDVFRLAGDRAHQRRHVIELVELVMTLRGNPNDLVGSPSAFGM